VVCNTKNVATVRSLGAGKVIDYTAEDFTTNGWQNLVLALWTSRTGDKTVVFPIPPRYTKKDVLFLKQLIEAGKYRAVIGRCYPLAQAVDATRYVETGQKTGNVVLTLSGDRGPWAGHPCRPQHRNLSQRVCACGARPNRMS
jgi:NADPH:quinone reductase-like Zn-dependent oxidoreductase